MSSSGQVASRTACQAVSALLAAVALSTAVAKEEVPDKVYVYGQRPPKETNAAAVRSGGSEPLLRASGGASA